MKHVEPRPFADPQITARKLLEFAAGVEPVNGRIHIEKIDGPFLGCKGTGAEFGAGIRYAVEKGWLELHGSGTFLELLPQGEDLLKRRWHGPTAFAPTGVAGRTGGAAIAREIYGLTLLAGTTRAQGI